MTRLATADDLLDPSLTMSRLGVIMTARPDEPGEAEGVLNPATAWGSDGELRLFPRLVGRGNYSRIGRARVVIADGVPIGVEREGLALEPDRAWERGVRFGGVEDPRITWIPSLQRHVMTYVALGPFGPRPAIAVSADAGLSWERLGPIQFGYEDRLGVDLNLYPNKDVVFFPDTVPGPDGTEHYALLHRPMWDFSFALPAERPTLPMGETDARPSIWISYIPAERVRRSLGALVRPEGHRVVARPVYDWEQLKIGAGPAPIRVDEGWLLIHHGVRGTIDERGAFTPQTDVTYSAGAMILDAEDPSRVLWRTAAPLLNPETADETMGIVANVVFPTAIERIGDQFFVFYGMADSRIGVARLDRAGGDVTG